jgi:hypothetical protein
VTYAVAAGPPPVMTLKVTGSGIQTKGAALFLADLAATPPVDIPIPASFAPASKIDTSGVATYLEIGVAQTAGIPFPPAAPPSPPKSTLRLTIAAADGEHAVWEF